MIDLYDFIHNISYSLLHTRNIVEGRTSKLEISYTVLFKYNTCVKSGKFQYESACDHSVHRFMVLFHTVQIYPDYYLRLYP